MAAAGRRGSGRLHLFYQNVAAFCASTLGGLAAVGLTYPGPLTGAGLFGVVLGVPFFMSALAFRRGDDAQLIMLLAGLSSAAGLVFAGFILGFD